MPSIFHQNINQWLCITLICLMCYWTVLYYLGHKAENIGNSFVDSVAAVGY